MDRLTPDKIKIIIFNRAMNELKRGSVSTATMSFITDCAKFGIDLGPLKYYFIEIDTAKVLTDEMNKFLWGSDIVVIEPTFPDRMKETKWLDFYEKNKDILDDFEVSIVTTEPKEGTIIVWNKVNLTNARFSKGTGRSVIYVYGTAIYPRHVESMIVVNKPPINFTGLTSLPEVGKELMKPMPKLVHNPPINFTGLTSGKEVGKEVGKERMKPMPKLVHNPPINFTGLTSYKEVAIAPVTKNRVDLVEEVRLLNALQISAEEDSGNIRLSKRRSTRK